MLLSGGQDINESYNSWLESTVASGKYSHVKYFQKNSFSSTSSTTPASSPEKNNGQTKTALAEIGSKHKIRRTRGTNKNSTNKKDPSAAQESETAETQREVGANYALHWSIDHELGKIKLSVAVSEAKGWVGLGFSEMGGMKGADMVIFEAKERKLYDAYSVAYEHPKTDPQQDWTLTHSVVEEDQGLIIFEAERDLNTNDPMDRAFILENDGDMSDGDPLTKIIGAWGDSEEMHYHGADNRIKGTVSFFKPLSAVKNPTTAAATEESSEIDVVFKNLVEDKTEGIVSMHIDDFVVPHKWETWYEWKCFTVKDLVQSQGLPDDTPLHLLGMEVILDPGELVHHITLYQDRNENISKCDPYNGPTSMMQIWNKGQPKKYYFPENVGMLLADESMLGGEGIGIPPKAFRLEIHYENPHKLKKVKDSSGLRLHYTSKLRKFTAGTMEFADPQVKLVGKPLGEGLRQHDFSCPSSCTQAHLPPQGVTIFYSLLHMHNKGQTMEIVHKRGGKELDVSRVEYFDFGFGGHVDEKRYDVLPGDDFVARCAYNSDPTLKFGYQANAEMCLGTVFYYPASLSSHMMCTARSNVKECVADHSSHLLPGLEALNRTFGVIQPGQPTSEVSLEVYKLSSDGENDIQNDQFLTSLSENTVGGGDKALLFDMFTIIFCILLLFVILTLFYVKPRYVKREKSHDKEYLLEVANEDEQDEKESLCTLNTSSFSSINQRRRNTSHMMVQLKD